MLVLTRKQKPGEDSARIIVPASAIQNGELIITVSVVQLRGNAVRLGFEAPDAVRILRSELKDEGERTTPLQVKRPQP